MDILFFSSTVSYFLCHTKIKTSVLGNGLPIFGNQNGGDSYFGFFSTGICSAVSFKRSQRELSNDVAEHRQTLKNYQNTHYYRFSFIPERGIAFPKRGLFLGGELSRSRDNFAKGLRNLPLQFLCLFLRIVQCHSLKNRLMKISKILYYIIIEK